jgi:hypothetical protein
MKSGFFVSGKPKGFFPEIAELTQRGVEPPTSEDSKMFNVLIFPEPHWTSELREWLSENTDMQVGMFGRFSWVTKKYRIEREYHGVRFVFDDMNIAVLFKLFWARGS